MSSWSSGYVTDIGYTFGQYRELVPAVLSFAALISGNSAPDPNRALTYCELGCGQGFSANLMAAANPGMEFHATDFNPTHIVGAKALAAAAGLRNIHFYDDSFADIAGNPNLPDFDIIVIHGIYSWISAENRRHIVNFLRARLSLGGLVYISYNTLPGWASIMPLRRLLADHGAAGSGPTAIRVGKAIDYAQRLVDVKAAFFKSNPVAAERFERIKTQSRNYVAHEYFNRDLTPFHHAEIVADLAEAKLTFAGSAQLLDNIDIANFTEEQQSLLNEATGPLERETLRDYLVDQKFRRDIFIKGPMPLAVGESREAWNETRFALSTRREDVPLKIAGVLGEAALQEEIYNPILDALAAGARTTRQLLAESKIAAIGHSRLSQALSVLAGAGHLQPALHESGDAERSLATNAFNLAVMERARLSANFQHLASPVSGGGVFVDRISQLFLLARRRGREDFPEFAWQILEGAGHRLGKDGKILATPEEHLEELRRLFDLFSARQLPVLRSLGIA
jgi:hypothetical protein